VPILFISALTKQRLLKALETAVEVFENRKQRISTSKFNDLMLPIIEATPPCSRCQEKFSSEVFPRI
jgi:GTP-binding protein